MTDNYTEIETQCASCGELTPAKVWPDGRANNGHFCSILAARKEDFKDYVEFPTKVDKILDEDVKDDRDDVHYALYVECPDCCYSCRMDEIYDNLEDGRAVTYEVVEDYCGQSGIEELNNDDDIEYIGSRQVFEKK